MKKRILFKTLFTLFLVSQYGYSQIDVVYNNLVWSDEFNTNGAIDSNKWFQQTQLPAGGSWFNNEVQHYTNRLENSFVDNGNLNIVAKRENFTDQNVTKQFTSARLNSKFAFTYGRVDIRAKAPNAQGTWPALWLLGKNVNEDGGFFDSNFGTTSWPACGEIDIMEHGIFPGQPINYIGAAIHTTSSSGNTINKGGIQASDIAQNYHIYSMNWSPNQITFLLDDVAFYNYNPPVKNASTWPFNLDQYFLLNVAMGGFAGTIPANFTQASMIIDYIRVYQNTAIDTQAPTNFVASLGSVTGSSVELLMNANDNSGTIAYTISYPGGTTTTVYNPSGVQKSVVIQNLASNTNYSFTIAATDMTGNTVSNSPIVLNATTNFNPQCQGNSTQATEGTFTLGYNYTFQTIGTDVKITFELLDNRVGLVAFLRRQSPFTETQMTNVSGQTFTQTITGQTLGSTISYAVKFAYAGGLSVTNYFSYVVGNNNCSLGISNFVMKKHYAYPNPVENILNLQLNDDQNKITLSDVLGKIHYVDVVNADYTFNMSGYQSGIYFLRVENSFGIQNLKIIKK
ncbi:family 16 glycosylhydrolase [Flavobacterium sp.]|jgi:beta-glucanase (GH16 family)|uniref:family 16 glycosylhydrolase n=1 Tax=Flavobacterium sp. TaxID=239 RepID=UPI0037C0B31C